MDYLLHHKWLPAFCIAAVALFVLGFAAWSTRANQTLTPAAVPQATVPAEVPKIDPPAQYIEVVDGCDWAYGGTCVTLRSGPGVEYPKVLSLRNGMVLRVADTVATNSSTWYKIGFDEPVRYQERVTSDWYVNTEYVHVFTNTGVVETAAGLNKESAKRIAISRSKQMLYAYDGDTVFMEQPVSTGLEFTPTPRGTFWIYKKTPSRYMQGPLPGISDQYYDLPGVPWDLYFTYQGGAIHGTYWHDHFGEPWSHGCVNLPIEQAKKLYEWADLGTPVTVQD